MLDIVDVEGRREAGKVDLKMGGFDLIWDGGPVMRFDKPTSLPTMLGCYNDRDKNQLRPARDERTPAGDGVGPKKRPAEGVTSAADLFGGGGAFGGRFGG